MKPISKPAQRILETLIAGLDGPEAHRKLDNGGEGIMAVCVERLTPRTVSVAHYYEQNGDRMADPDVVFWRGPDGRYYPAEYTQAALGLYQHLIEFEGEVPVRFMRRAQADVAAFCTHWMRNIRHQQKLG